MRAVLRGICGCGVGVSRYPPIAFSEAFELVGESAGNGDGRPPHWRRNDAGLRAGAAARMTSGGRDEAFATVTEPAPCQLEAFETGFKNPGCKM